MSIEARLTQLEEKLVAMEEERDQYRKLYEMTSLELARVRRHLFGRKAEVVNANQAQLAFELVDPVLAQMVEQAAAQTSEPRERPRRKSKPTGRKPLPNELPVERIELPPPVATDGLVKIGEEVSETIEWRPGSAVRVQVVRPKYANPKDESAGVTIADPPDKPIPKCKAGVGMLAHVIVSKYADHIPLNRQEKILHRQGVDLSRSTMSGWLEPCATLLGRITEAMHAEAIATAPWIGVDATGVLVQAKEQCKRGHFWVMTAGRDHVLFRYSKRHTGRDAHTLLKGYEGYVVADASSVYHELYRTESVTEVGCWAHTRRNFFESLLSDEERALAGIGFIKQLYRIDREIRESKPPPSRRYQERKARAGPVVASFFEWCESELPKVLPKSPIGKALQYAVNQREPLSRFLEDSKLRLDNNPSELELRRQVVGRKNWLFCGSDDAAEWNTVFVSLIASCELHGIEPWAYLRDVLSLVPRWNARKAIELAPKYWKATSALESTQEMLRTDVFRSVSAVEDEHTPTGISQ